MTLERLRELSRTEEHPLKSDAAFILDMVLVVGPDSYTCRHYETASGNCREYDRRPALCRDYPYGQACKYVQCTMKETP